MFNAQKSAAAKQTKKAAPARDANAVTILTSGCHFSGKLYCRGASRIGGKIEGQVVSEGLLIIEEEALITAEIKADEVIIQGRVQGKLVATGRVELTASSQVDGDISTPVLVVREGARFNGHSTVLRRDEGQGTAKAPRIAAVGGGKSGKMPDIDRDVKADGAGYKGPEVHVSAS